MVLVSAAELLHSHPSGLPWGCAAVTFQSKLFGMASFPSCRLQFPAEGLPEKHCPEFPAQWGVVEDWSDLEQPRLGGTFHY